MNSKERDMLMSFLGGMLNGATIGKPLLILKEHPQIEKTLELMEKTIKESEAQIEVINDSISARKKEFWDSVDSYLNTNGILECDADTELRIRDGVLFCLEKSKTEKTNDKETQEND